MQVYKSFGLILKKNAGMLSIYLIIFLGLSIALSRFGKEEIESVFQETALDMAVIDRDESQISQVIYSWLDDRHHLIEIEDNYEAIQDDLFFRTAEYIVIIPAGFEESFMNQGDVPLETIKVPDSTTGIYIDAQLENFMRLLEMYLISGYPPAEAGQQAAAQATQAIDVHMTSSDRGEYDVKSVYYYYRYMPYVITAILISGLGPIINAFQRPDLRQRNICSPVSRRSQSLQIALGCLSFSLGIWLLLMLLGIILYRQDFFEPNALVCMANSFVFMLISASIAYMAGLGAKTPSILSALTNTISLGLCFLGGIFVPHSMMTPGMLTAAQFVPSYWYVKINDLMGQSSQLTKTAGEFTLQALGIQLGFAVVIFSVGLLITKKNHSAA